MDAIGSTNSVSKGVFVFKNGSIRNQTKAKQRKKSTGNKSTPLLGNEVTGQLFYKTYSNVWQKIENDIENIQKLSNLKVTEDLLIYIDEYYELNQDSILPVAALLTGINQPDHYQKFESLAQNIIKEMEAGVIVLLSRDCGTVKSIIESMVYGLIVSKYDDPPGDYKRTNKSKYTMSILCEWYSNQCSRFKRKLVIILPDFECFDAEILQDFILILSSYCNRIPFVLVLGVATAVTALHSTLPYHVTSKIRLKIFETPSAPTGLNDILDNVIISPSHKFQLSGKTFKFLTNIFLFYDFSVNGFVQGFKYCLMEHYFRGNIYALCTEYNDSLSIISTFNHDDYETLRHFLSFRNLVENCGSSKIGIKLLLDDKYLQNKLPILLRNCHIYFKIFRCFAEFLHILVRNLPKFPLGKHKSDLYYACSSKEITETDEFKESWQVLSFYAKDEFVEKFTEAIELTEIFVNEHLCEINDVNEISKKLISKNFETLKSLIGKVSQVGMMTNTTDCPNNNSTENILKNLSRQELKEKLLQMSKTTKSISPIMKAVNETMEFIKTEIIFKHLRPLTKRGPALHELFVFSDTSTVRKNIIGTPRAAMHSALNDPHFYLQCECCQLETGQNLLSTFPDLTVAYKLHLECGRMINLFDWLQAFRSVVDYTDEDQEQINPKIQARFTRAVAELQFLGYVKASKRKTDHVARLTW